MKYKALGNDIIVSDVDCLDLDLTLDCGQAFRWQKQADGSWSGVAGGYFLNVSKQGDTFVFKNTTKDSFDSFWINYFDLSKDYKKIIDDLLNGVRKDVEDYLASEDGDYYEIKAYAPRTDGKNDETFHYSEKLTKQLSDLWNKVKIQ